MERIKAKLDQCFDEYVMNEELENLKEEVLANMTDHYADLISQGESNEAAEQIVLESMGDIRALLREIGAVRKTEAAYRFDPFGSDTIRGFTDTVNSLFTNLFQGREENGTREEVYANIEKIDITGMSMDIHISPSSDEMVYVRAEGNLDQIMMEVTGDTLVIKELRSGRIFQNGMDVFLQVPEHLHSADIQVLSGDLTAEMVNLESIRFQSTSGDLEIRQGSVKDLAVKTASGDAYIRLKEIHRFYGELASGDVDIRCENAGSLACACQSGDIDAEIEESFDSIQFKTVSGDVSLKMKHPEKIRTELRSMSGSIDSNVSSFEEGNEVSIQTISGDIRVR